MFDYIYMFLLVGQPFGFVLAIHWEYIFPEFSCVNFIFAIGLWECYSCDKFENPSW